MTLEIVVRDLIPDDIIEMLNEDAVYQVVANIADGARQEWLHLAGKNLNTSSRDYQNAIQAVVHRPGIALLTLLGQPANIIEHGSDAVDLRDWLLGPNVPEALPGQKGKRRAKDGSFYRAVPFRHGTPGTGGAVGRAMGDAYSGTVKDAAALGRAVYKAAKSLDPGERIPAHMRYGRGQKKTVPKLKAHHKTDIYAGMQKIRGAYDKVSQSQYQTFRTISTANTEGWIRPATQAAGLVPMVQDYIERVAPAAFQAYVDSLGGS